MNNQYTVGMNHNGRNDHVSVEAEDALIAALKVKSRHPGAVITYARKRNARADMRHPALEDTDMVI